MKIQPISEVFDLQSLVPLFQMAIPEFLAQFSLKFFSSVKK
jgi:hypothetical protein